MLLQVCTVIDHRKCQNVVRESVTYSVMPGVALFLFLPHFDVICDLLLNQHTVTWTILFKQRVCLLIQINIFLQKILIQQQGVRNEINFPIFCPLFTHNTTDMGQHEPCDDQVHHRRNSLLLNELQHLAKIKTPKLLEISNKGVTNFTQTKAKKN